MNLMKLLQRASDLEVDEQLDFKELGLVWDDIKNKTDSIYHLITKWDAEATRLKTLASQFNQASVTHAKNKARLLEYVKYSMQANDTEQLNGDKFTFKITRRKAYNYDELNDELAALYPDYVRVKKEWNKIKLKDDFKSGKIKELVTEKTSESIKIGVKK